ncbi:MAG TPA: type III-A CRISPR-associated RAMP protein Csm3 [Saprospiraceae bacterium]|nr:type III-A CRISPR-associated RAMP protein Csm3 [Saprospiraceae bacterium]
MSKLLKKIAFRGELELITGLHIGDSSENVQIGGVDKVVVRRRDNGQPYIPGSSLKGKIRSLLEQSEGAIAVGASKGHINKIFGFAKDNLPSKLIVRDAYLTKDSAELLKKSDFLDYPFTEVKFENSIQRLRGIAENPRKIERVPAGAKFAVEIILNVWENDLEEEYIEVLRKGILLLHADYLGGNGSRGYGQVELTLDLTTPVILYENKDVADA